MKKSWLAVAIAAALLATSSAADAGRIYIPAAAAIYPATENCSSEKHETQTSNESGAVFITASCPEDGAFYFQVAYPSDAATSGTPFTADIAWAKYGDGDADTVCWELGTKVINAGDDTDTILSGSWSSVSVSDAGAGDSIRNIATTPAFLPGGASGSSPDATLYVRVKRDTGACADSEDAGTLAEVLDLTIKY